MWISGRAAAALLREETGITTRSARRVIAAGLAGRPEAVGRTHLYDRARVADLAHRPLLDRAELDRVCPWGAFVARRTVDVEATTDERLAALSGGWEFSVWVGVWLRAMVERHGYVPLLATVSGFVAGGAEIVDAVGGGSVSRYSLVLRLAGPWLAQVQGHRFPTGPGREWSVLGVPWKRSPASVPARRVGESRA